MAAAGCSDDSKPDHLDPAWTSITSPADATLRDVAMSASDGWACGDKGTLLHTTDDGKTWTKVALPTAANLFAYGSIIFGGSQNIDFQYAVGDSGTIVLSKDGGLTWKVKHTGTESLRSIAVSNTDSNEIFIAAGNDGPDGIVLVSTDHMETWQRRVVKANAKLNAVAFTFEQGWVVGADGLLLESDDSAVTWHTAGNAPTAVDLRAVEDGAASLVVVGDGVIMWRVAEGFVVSWGATEGTRVPDLTDVSFNIGLGKDPDGQAQLVRIDDAHNYTVEDLGVHTVLHAVASSAYSIVAVGDGGAIFVGPPGEPLTLGAR